jgi:hypothetical protein
MDLSQKCKREGCSYKKHSVLNVSDFYCCRCCKISNKKHGPACEKKLIIEKLIYCDAAAGFNEVLIQLGQATEYAIKFNYSILLISRLY